MKYTRQLLLFVLLVATAALWLGRPAPPVLAHANLVTADPAPNTVLEQSPPQVVIRFTEPLEPEFSAIQVLDVQGQAVDSGDSRQDTNDPTVLIVSLPPLPDGTYTVVWKNVSTVDGHPVRGSYVFAVGRPLTGPAAGATAEGDTLLPSPIEPPLRSLVLWATLVITGGLAFNLLILTPSLAASGKWQVASGRSPIQNPKSKIQNGGDSPVENRLSGHTLGLVWLGMAALLVASVAQLLSQTMTVLDIPLREALGRPLLAILLQTGWGRLWLWRLGICLVLLGVLPWPSAVTSGRRREERRENTWQWAALALSLGLLLTLSLASHAAATAEVRTAAVSSDYLHLLAAAFWVGGLFHFAYTMPLLLRLVPGEARRPLLAALVPRFSTLAVLSVGTLIITGLYASYAQVTILPALKTPYGRALLVKLGLFVPLIAMGALNLLGISPRLADKERGGKGAGGQGGQVTISVARPLPVSVPVMLRWSVAAEALLAAAILVAVGWLVTLEPARQVASRMGLGRANDLNFVDTADTTTVQLIIEPGQVGLNRFQVTLTDPIQRAIPNATVTVRLTYLETEMGGMATEATHQGVGVYETPDTFLSLAGQWQAEVIVRRPDAFDAQTAFRFEVMPGSAAGSAAIAPTAETGKLLWGIELALLGLLFTGVSVPLGSWRTRRGRATAVPGTLALLAGIFVVVSAQLGGRPPERINPIAPTQESILMGQSLYATKCLECHGPTGLGNGPRAMEVNPPPAVLITHVPLHTDGELFDFIYEGRPNTAMRPFRDELAEEEIWHIVNFIKTFVIE